MLSRKVRVAATASVLALAVSMEQARAQDAGGSGQANSSLPTAAAQPQSDEIVVTGVRQSLQTADNIKRNSDSNVNAIVAEDLGKFTDTSIADALQRVPGVQIQRDNRAQGPGTGISIRGLGADFALSTINGREYLGNPAFGNYRNVDYDSIPPEILAGVLVYKSPTASLIEPGLAGEVDLRTLRPLDQKTTNGHDIFAVLNAEGQFETELKSVQPRINAVIGGKFLDGTLGVYVSGVYNKERIREPRNYYLYSGGVQGQDVVLRNPDGTFNKFNNIKLPDGVSNSVETRNNVRTAFAAGLEWKPDDHWHLNVDFEYNRLQRDVTRDGGSGYLGYGAQNPLLVQAGGAAVRGADLVFLDSTQIINNNILDPKMVDKTPVHIPLLGSLQIGVARNRYRDQSLTGGVNLTYHSSRVDAALDFAHSESKYVTTGICFSNNQDPLPIELSLDLRGNTPKIAILTNGDYTSLPQYLGASNNVGLTSFPNAGNNGGSRDQARLDFAFRPIDAITLKAGVRYAASSYIRRSIFTTIGSLVTSLPYQSGTVVQGFYPIAQPRLSYDALIKAFPQVATFIANGSPVLTGGLPADQNAASAQYGANQGDLLKEATTAIYAEIDGKADLGSWHFSGNAGVRALNVYDKGTGYQGTIFRVGDLATPTPGTVDTLRLVTDTNEYWRYLPSINLLIQPRQNVNLRLSYNKSLSLPVSSALIPSGSGIIHSVDATGLILPNTFGGGNTRLKPTTSDNFDATVEYYTGHIALVASGFYKRLHDLVSSITTNGTVPGQPNEVFFGNIGRSVNALSGFAYGFEASANVPFTFLPGPLDGLGIEANYTYVNGKAGFFPAPEPESSLPGSSKHNATLTGIMRSMASARVRATRIDRNIC